MKNILATLVLLLHLSPAFTNSPFFVEKTFRWDDKANLVAIDQTATTEVWSFDGAFFPDEAPTLPHFFYQFPVDGFGKMSVEILEAQYESFEMKDAPDKQAIKGQLDFSTSVNKQRNGFFGHLAFVPIIRSGSGFERLVSVRLRINMVQQPYNSPKLGPTTFNSVLGDGDIYKFAVDQTGVYQLTYNFLKDELEIPIDDIDPRTIKIYGNGGGMLAENVRTERIDDLEENNILIVGENDGRFDNGDYILFYGEGPDKWIFNSTERLFNMQKNIYSTQNFYFIKISPENGARVPVQPSQDINNAVFTTNTFDAFARLEDEKENVLHDWIKAQGSGKKWFGDHFKVAREYTYNNQFNFPNLIPGIPVRVKAEMMIRSNAATSSNVFTVTINNQVLESSGALTNTKINTDQDNESNFGNFATINNTVLLADGDIDLKVTFPDIPGKISESWLDFIQINARQTLTMDGNQMNFRDIESANFPTTTFQLSNASSNITIWDVSNPLKPKTQEAFLNGNQLEFATNTNFLEIKEFIAFNQNQGFLTPTAVGKIENQNLHGLDDLDMIIIYHPEFAAEAQRLAEHRAEHSNLNVSLARIDHVFNEFSSGSKDPTAIRDLAKLLYDRTSRFKYILLFGDGSFDARDIYELGSDFIPVYEKDSMNPIFSFPTDDYFALLEGSPNSDPLAGDVSVAIGRLPVKNTTEAQSAVDKIIDYDQNADSFRDWRNRLVFVGDDEDTNRHSGDANRIADTIAVRYPNFNLDKIYLDAFPQVSTPGGDRFPEATAALNNSIFKGVLAVTYLGHGGARGWAQERVLNLSDIFGWENKDQLPLFVTATCSFTGYDDPGFTTAGEEVFLNPNGGSIALFTTVRAVFASSNATLTRETLNELFVKGPTGSRPLGEVINAAKNKLSSNSTVINSRKFTLIGDPSQQLAIPELSVATTKINLRDVTDNQLDTLKALQKVTIEGIIQDNNGQFYPDFNGIIYPTIFDKAVTVSTLGQDSGSPIFNFSIQKNILFKGTASVNQGRFSFTFVVPKDINYQFGFGKISYYAADTDKNIDAGGSFNNIIIGGTDPNAASDDQGPIVEVFMNTEDFVFGGITDPNPTLLVKLADDNGINVVGNSIGHDLEGVLDQNTQNTLLLNDFYESELDDYTKGVVRYPLSDLQDGRHEIRVKAWDVANNSAEGYTEFIVVSSENVVLEHVLNYPNPFTDNTCFQFDHNLSNQELDILIQIYTVSGRLVKTLEASILSDGAIRQDDCIRWDGKDDFGDQLARGVYLYKVKVRAINAGLATLNGESEFEKLVILK